MVQLSQRIIRPLLTLTTTTIEKLTITKGDSMSINSIQGNMTHMGMHNPPKPLTDEQKIEVASILSNFDASSLTEDDALSINEAFREAGFKGGPGLRSAIEEAGFDAEEVRSLALPPQGPPPAGGGAPSGVNKEALSELLEILDMYDFDSMTSEQEEELVNQLKSSDLFFSGLLINQKV